MSDRKKGKKGKGSKTEKEKKVWRVVGSAKTVGATEEKDEKSESVCVADELQQYVTPNDPPIVKLEIKDAFDNLTKTEKLYLHWMAQASWLGSEICYHQVSNESPKLFRLIQLLFSQTDVARWKVAALAEDVTNREWGWFMQYIASFLTNSGNYASFGDTKFIPRLSKAKFVKIVKAAPIREKERAPILKLLTETVDALYSLEAHELSLGFPISPETGKKLTSTYYSPDVTKEEMDIVGALMVDLKMSPYNTRLFKTGDKKFELKVASADKKKGECKDYKGYRIEIVYGDHSPLLAKTVAALKEARKYVANDTQGAMIDAYIKSFQSGSIDDHKTAQRHWVKDISPVVETNIGFIESYRDPLGVRGEFEGFVAIVNKETSKKFGTLVSQAPDFLPKLPWPKEYEKDVFSKPDFTSLEVFAYGSSGIPSGINIPNYDDIRQDLGFKNVSLGNVISAGGGGADNWTFISDADQELYNKLRIPAFEVQVGLHELLGHGSGKLFMEGSDGKLNYPADVINPITKEKISSHYKAGETWDQMFPAIGQSYEECRAECVGVYLSTVKEILEVFGHETKEAQSDIMYVNWLNMVRSGVMALEFYSPDTKKWGQAHMRARWGILKVLLQAGGGLVKLDITDKNCIIRLDRTKILSVGAPAIGKFLLQLQIYKSSADFKNGSKLYEETTSVADSDKKLRDIVLSLRKPRRLFIQPHSRINDEGEVILEEFPLTYEGIIHSYIARFPLD